jgi:hypothetical protein
MMKSKELSKRSKIRSRITKRSICSSCQSTAASNQLFCKLHKPEPIQFQKTTIRNTTGFTVIMAADIKDKQTATISSRVKPAAY